VSSRRAHAGLSTIGGGSIRFCIAGAIERSASCRGLRPRLRLLHRTRFGLIRLWAILRLSWTGRGLIGIRRTLRVSRVCPICLHISRGGTSAATLRKAAIT
jgi:hypothetical protein